MSPTSPLVETPRIRPVRHGTASTAMIVETGAAVIGRITYLQP
jgi:hypothetical protein